MLIFVLDCMQILEDKMQQIINNFTLVINW